MDQEMVRVRRHLTQMKAIGRRFQLGDLFDYRNDQIIADYQLWTSPVLESATLKLNAEVKLKLTCQDLASNKWEHVALDQHLQLSVMAGLINKFRGASYYLKEQANLTEITRILICRLKSRKDQLNLPALFQQGARIPAVPDATHVVVGITYGAEACCVLSKQLDENYEDEDARKEAEELLSKVLNEMENALEDRQDVIKFKEQFEKEEKRLLTGIKCRIYSDHQTQTVRECTVFDAYKGCLKLIEEMYKKDVEMKKAVPIAVVLCPLKLIDSRPDKDVEDMLVSDFFKFRDVSTKLVGRCCRIMTDLEQMSARADVLRSKVGKTNSSSFRHFSDAIGKYQELLKSSLKKAVTKARQAESDDEEVKKIASIAENLAYFKTSQLEHWFGYKKSELEMTEKMASLKGIIFVPSKTQLDIILGESFDKKYALVLNVPLMDEQSNAILKAMTDYVDNYTRLVDITDKDVFDTNKGEDAGLPWHMVQSKRKQVLARIRELAYHVEKNKQLESQVLFLITPGECGDKFGCSYSVFEADRLLKDNLNGLPSPPTGLRVHLATIGSSQKNPSPIQVEWDYEDPEYPCEFLVQYRSKESCESWTEKKTAKPGQTRIVINLGCELTKEIRVAADSCIGRSEFSDVIYTDSIFTSLPLDGSSTKVNENCIDPLQEPPTMHLLRDTEVLQSCQMNDRATDVEAIPYQDGLNHQIKAISGVVSYASGSFPLEVTAAEGNPVADTGNQVETGHIPVGDRRIAEVFAEECGQRRGQPNVYLLHAIQKTTVEDFRWFDIGQPEAASDNPLNHKVIILMGATGCGKSTLIDGMVNYILGVQWKDPFRFKCVREDDTISRNQAHSQTSSVTAYTIHHQEGMAVPYSITIIDTPGYGLIREKEVTLKIQQFLMQQEIRVDQIHAVCFVAASDGDGLTTSDFLDSVLSLFGKDVKDSIRLLVTFADNEDPPVVDSCKIADFPLTSPSAEIVYSKFNNYVLCSSNVSTRAGLDKLFWDMGQENYTKFFTMLGGMDGRDMTSTRQVIQHRKNLERCLISIENELGSCLVNIENMEIFQRKMREFSHKMENNKNFTIEKTVVRVVKIPCENGTWAYNCHQCQKTCKANISVYNFHLVRNEKISCSRLFCPCPASVHEYQRFQWRSISEKHKTIILDMKAEFESNYKGKQSNEKLLVNCADQLNVTKTKVISLLEQVSSNVRSLESTALRSNSFSPADYLNLIKSRVAEEQKPGYLTRLELLAEFLGNLAVSLPVV